VGKLYPVPLSGRRGKAMRYKKTPQIERRTYKVLDEQGQMIAELKPDENGVTADMIKKLHAVDDHEVYVNCKELRLPPYLEECYREWRQRYISQYIQEHGSHPKTDEIPTAHRQIVYLDEIRDLPESNAAVQLALSHYYDDEPSDPVLLLRWSQNAGGYHFSDADGKNLCCGEKAQQCRPVLLFHFD
jgi:hypothetical protein